MFFAGKNKVVSIKCEEYDPRFIRERVNKGETLHFSLKPVFWFSFETAVMPASRVASQAHTAVVPSATMAASCTFAARTSTSARGGRNTRGNRRRAEALRRNNAPEER
jgi:hypothetical protein